MSRFETRTLTTRNNLRILTDMPGVWADQVRRRKPPKQLILESLTTLQTKLIKIGAKVVRHAR